MEPLLENNKIYVRGLPAEVTETALREHFEKYGRVVKASFAVDGQTKRPKDFGFVWFANEESAKAAIGDVEEHVILGTKVEVKEAIRRERSPIQNNEGDKCPKCASTGNSLRHGKKIFVGGLPPNLTQEDFKSFFENFGKTTDVVIIVNTETRKPRGFGFVTYESEESARAVLRTSRYLIYGKEVEVKMAIPKEEVANTTDHPNVHPRGQHHPSPGFNGYHHDSGSWSRHGWIEEPPYANSALMYTYTNFVVAAPPAYAYSIATPFSAYADGMAAPLPARADNVFHWYNARARTTSDVPRAVPRPFTKIRISKPHAINGEGNASSSPCVEDPSPVCKDSNLNGRPSPSGKKDGKDQASISENGQNDS